MRTQFYIKVNPYGSVKTSKTKPSLDIDEVSVFVTLQLPDILFKKPQITANIVADTENVTPFIIDADTTKNVQDAIETATGLKIDLIVQNPQ